MATHITEGSKAPSFTSKDQNGTPVSLSDYKGKKVILFFYPEDDTPPSLLLLQLMNRKQQQVISIIVNIGLNINFSLKRVAADLIAGFI